MSSKHFDALISPDAYEYLDETPQDELLEDQMLKEQEDSDIYDDEDEITEETPEDTDDSDMYTYNSLFDELDDENDSEESYPEDSEAESELMFQDDENDDITVARDVSENCNEFIAGLINKLPKYNSVANYMKNLPRLMQDQLAEVIEGICNNWKVSKRDKMFEIPNTGISVAVLGKSSDPMVQIQRLESIGAVMVASDKNRWTALMIYLNENAEIDIVESKDISQLSFTDWQWKTVLEQGEKIKARKQ